METDREIDVYAIFICDKLYEIFLEEEVAREHALKIKAVVNPRFFTQNVSLYLTKINIIDKVNELRI